MASLAAHFAASLLLCPVGLRRLISATSLYLRNPTRYTSKIWYSSQPKWKNLDLYTLLITLPVATISNVFAFSSFSNNPAFKFSFLDQSLVALFFWAVLILIFMKESCDLYIIHDNFVFLFAGIGFTVEYYLSGRGSVGIGGEVYSNLGGLAALCGVCCVYLSIRPSAFFAEFLLSSGIVLKGTWVMQVGLSLYTDAFGLRGCDKITRVSIDKSEVDVKCELEDDMWRGMVLMNLLFVVHVFVIIFVSFVVFGFLNRCRNAVFDERVEVGSENTLMHPHSEIEME